MSATTVSRLLATFAAFFLLLGSAQAQRQIQLQLIVRNPMPERLSDWDRDPSLIQLRVTNPVGNPAYRGAHVSFEVRDAQTNRVVIRSKDGDARIPTIDIGDGGWTGSFFGRNLIDRNAVSVDASLRSVAVATDALPEGSYHFCLTLLNGIGGPIPTIGGCAQFTIIHPRPPTLILPVNHATFLPGTEPQFTWTPVTPAPQMPVTYRLRIVPVYQNQSEQTAIAANPPLLDRNVGSALSYRYQATDPSLINYFGIAYGFAWQVSVTDAGSGQIYSSEVHGFTFGSNTPLAAMQNIDDSRWIIQWNPGNGGGGKGGKNGGANLGNIGKISSDCHKPRTFRIWMNFGNMGLNTFPMEVLEITGVDNTTADISSDGETVTLRCENTGSFTITVKVRALPLGLSPFKDIYTLQITIDCKCGDPDKAKGKDGGEKGENPGNSQNGGEGSGSHDEAGKEGSGSGSTDGGSKDESAGGGSGSSNGSDQKNAGKEEEDPCKKLTELEQKIKELKEKIDAADAASQKQSELEDQKAELEDAIAKEKKALDNDWKTWESLGKMTDEAFRKYGERSEQYKSLKSNRNAYLKRIMDHQDRLSELEKKRKETNGELEKAKAASKAADEARQELERLTQEYEQLKKKCDEKNGSGTQDGNSSGSGNGSGSGSGREGSPNGSGQNGNSGANGNGSGNGSTGERGGNTPRNRGESGSGNNGNGGGNDSGQNNLTSDDTILRRPSTQLGNAGETQGTTTPIQMTELSLQGTAPINVGQNGGNQNGANVDCSKIRASRGTGATGGMIVGGGPGSLPPNSQVTISDKNGKSTTVTAGADGSFRANETDLPDGFDHTVGDQLTVTASGKSCRVTIER